MNVLISKKDNPKVVYNVREDYFNLYYSKDDKRSDLEILKDLGLASHGDRLVAIFGQNEPIYINPLVDNVCINNIEIKLSDLLKEIYSKPENVRPMQWNKELYKKYKLEFIFE